MAVGTPTNFQWHIEAPSFTYHLTVLWFTRSIVDHDLNKKTDVVGTLNDLEP